MIRIRARALALLALAALSHATVTTAAEQVRLRIGHDQPTPSIYDEGHQTFRKLAGERSQGRLKVEVFPAAQLGGEVAMIESVRLGALHGRVAHVANASTVVPELALFSVSCLFKDRAHSERVLSDPRFQRRVGALVASQNLGLKVVGYYSAGVRDVYTRRGPARTPEELKGTKIRVMKEHR